MDTFPRVLGLPVKFYWTVARGGTGGIIGLVAATQALELGLANYVVVACGEAGWTRAHGPRRGALRGNSIYGNDLLGFSAGASAASSHAFFARRYMYEYGATSEDFGAVAVAQRAWAGRNPEARFSDVAMTIDDHQNSRWVIEPYHLLDICLQSDAGTAIVVTTAERARDLKKPPVSVLGIGFGDQARQAWWDKTNYTQLDVGPAREAAFGQAGISLADIDVAEFYDCFTGEVLFHLEDYGWCEKGSAGAFIREGNTGYRGSIPVNTGGGLLSDYYLFDFTGLQEAVLQLRGEGGGRQVEGAEIALATGHGGEMLMPGMCSTHACVVLGR